MSGEATPRKPRIPAALQAVFLASSRGNQVHKPPPKVDKKVDKRSSWFSSWGQSSKMTKKKEPVEEPVAERFVENPLVACLQREEAKPSTPVERLTPRAKLPTGPLAASPSPQTYLEAMLRTRGYSTERFQTLKSAYHNKPTKLQIASHSLHLVELIRNRNVSSLAEILKSGMISPNPCNQFGESLLHMVCRRGDAELLQVFVDAGCSLQVTDNRGRTPLHDACWAAEPALETVKILLELDPFLVQMVDSRGTAPLSYVRRAHWPVWIAFLEEHTSTYWPSRPEGSPSVVPALVLANPQTCPVRDPPKATSLEMAKRVAEGRMEELDETVQCSDSSSESSESE